MTDRNRKNLGRLLPRLLAALTLTGSSPRQLPPIPTVLYYDARNAPSLVVMTVGDDMVEQTYDRSRLQLVVGRGGKTAGQTCVMLAQQGALPYAVTGLSKNITAQVFNDDAIPVDSAPMQDVSNRMVDYYTDRNSQKANAALRLAIKKLRYATDDCAPYAGIAMTPQR